MGEIETVAKLVDIIRRQAEIIRELHSCLGQHTAANVFDSEIERVGLEADGFITKLEQGV